MCVGGGGGGLAPRPTYKQNKCLKNCFISFIIGLGPVEGSIFFLFFFI